MEKRAKNGEGKGVPLNDSDEESKGEPKTNSKEAMALKDLVTRLQQEVKRRDNEIVLLVQHLNKKKGESEGIPVTQAHDGDDLSNTKKMTFYEMMMNKGNKESAESNSEVKSNDYPAASTTASKTTQDRVQEILRNDENLISEVKLDKEDLVDKAKAFEKFRRYYRKNEAMEERKSILKAKMVEGKNTGVEAKEIKQQMTLLTTKVEQIRREKVMRGLVDAEGNIERSEEEDEIQSQVHELKIEYQDRYEKLRNFKAEIERLRNQIDRIWQQ
jgi:hypothetical protein